MSAFRIWLLFGFLVSLACAERGTPSGMTSSETHFLESCSGGCAESDCICGRCTEYCVDDSDCSALDPRASCVTTAACGGAYCSLLCDEDTDCRDDEACLAGECVSIGLLQESGACGDGIWQPGDSEECEAVDETWSAACDEDCTLARCEPVTCDTLGSERCGVISDGCGSSIDIAAACGRICDAGDVCSDEGQCEPSIQILGWSCVHDRLGIPITEGHFVNCQFEVDAPDETEFELECQLGDGPTTDCGCLAAGVQVFPCEPSDRVAPVRAELFALTGGALGAGSLEVILSSDQGSDRIEYEVDVVPDDDEEHETVVEFECADTVSNEFEVARGVPLACVVRIVDPDPGLHRFELSPEADDPAFHPSSSNTGGVSETTVEMTPAEPGELRYTLSVDDGAVVLPLVFIVE